MKTTLTDEIQRIRQFNRFYLRIMGLTTFYIHDSTFSATEALILYEINHVKKCTATQLAEYFQLDKGYISRVIKKLEKKNYIKRDSSANDKRIKFIHITKKGREELRKLTEASSLGIAKRIQALNQDEITTVVLSMEEIEKAFTKIF